MLVKLKRTWGTPSCSSAYTRSVEMLITVLVFYLFNLRIPLEGQLVVVIEVRELLLRQLYTTWTCDIIDTSFLKKLI